MAIKKVTRKQKLTLNYAEAKNAYDALSEIGNFKFDFWNDVLENIIELRPTINKVEQFISEATKKIGMIENGNVSFSDPKKNKEFNEACHPFLSNTAAFQLHVIPLKEFKKKKFDLSPNVMLVLIDLKIVVEQ